MGTNKAANRDKNRWLSRGVVIVGLALSACGFYLDLANNFPAIEALLTPEYSGAKEAMRRLEETGVLSPGDPGFDALEPPVLRQVAMEVPRAAFQRVTRMDLIVQGLVIDRVQSTNAQTKITLSGDIGPRYVDLIPIMEKFEKSAHGRLLFLSQFIFWSGAVIVLRGAFL